MYVIIVEFKIRSEDQEKFLYLIAENARLSLKDEPGCLQFDVCVDENDASYVFLYEQYKDAEAFAQHKRTPHFAHFDEASAPFVLSKVVRPLTRHWPA